MSDDECFCVSLQTPAAVSQVVRILEESKEAVSLLKNYNTLTCTCIDTCKYIDFLEA